MKKWRKCQRHLSKEAFLSSDKVLLDQEGAVLQYTSQYSFGWDFGGMAIMDLKWVGWIPPVAIPNPDQPTLAIFWHIITSVPKWKVQNHLEFLFKDVFKNYVLNHFLNWKERESCSSADATSVHIDHSIFAMGFIHICCCYFSNTQMIGG